MKIDNLLCEHQNTTEKKLFPHPFFMPISTEIKRQTISERIQKDHALCSLTGQKKFEGKNMLINA